MSYKQFSKEVSELNSSIIMDKCNSKAPEHIIVICNFNNMIVERVDSYSGKNHVKSVLSKMGYEVCKRSEANHYAEVCLKGNDKSDFHFWIHK